jgi:hypothetical protein
MPVHDWTRVDAGIFHHFHHEWISELSRALNRGLLPPDYYALIGQSGRGLGPIAIRHLSEYGIVAMFEIISPAYTNSWHGHHVFVEKAVQILREGIHLVMVDLVPPGSRDPRRLHSAIWGEFSESDVELPSDKPLTLASYVSGPMPMAFVEPTTVGASLPEMPLFLTPEYYIPLPLEATYQSAWDAVPSFWQDVLTAPSSA